MVFGGLLFAAALETQTRAQSPGAAGTSAARPPASTGGVFPLSQVRAGLEGTAWTVFSGSKPEPMQVEILGLMRGVRGPGQDLILARLHGARAEYTGVVDGMSGSPVYIGDKLLGALSYRIGQFAKEPMAGITPIEQMLAVRDLPIAGAAVADQAASTPEDLSPRSMESVLSAVPRSPGADASSLDQRGTERNFQMMETPLVMSGFRPEAIQFWQQQMAGTALQSVAAGGMGGASQPVAAGSKAAPNPDAPDAAAEAAIEPGSAVSLLLVRGDLEVAATCTVTYIDPRQLLACGHPVLQLGAVSLPMTAADVVATLASPLDAFKIINTGATIGAFTEDRGAAIRGVLGARARMIPMHITVDSPQGRRHVNVEILDQPSLTPQAMAVVLYNSLIQDNDSTAEASYHIEGSIDLSGLPPAPINLWASSGQPLSAAMQAALLAGTLFNGIYANLTRQNAIRAIEIHVEAVPRRVQVDLEAARLISNDTAYAGDTILVEATLRPWQQPARNVRIPITLPARLAPGNLRLLVSDAGTLDRTLNQAHSSTRQPDLESILAQNSRLHAADLVYVSLLVPETQAGIAGQTLTSLPLSMANALEPLRSAEDVGLNGESAVVAAQASAGGILSGFQILNVRILPGGGLN